MGHNTCKSMGQVGLINNGNRTTRTLYQLRPYTNSDTRPTRTLPTRTLRQTNSDPIPTRTPSLYNQLGHYSDPADRLYRQVVR